MNTPNPNRTEMPAWICRDAFPMRPEDLPAIVASFNEKLQAASLDYVALVSRAERAEAEVKRLKQRLLTAAGDDLCRLSQEEIKDLTGGKVPISPKDEFLASCERFHAQIAGEAGVNQNCLTLAQLIAENERLSEQLADAEQSSREFMQKWQLEYQRTNNQTRRLIAAQKELDKAINPQSQREDEP